MAQPNFHGVAGHAALKKVVHRGQCAWQVIRVKALLPFVKLICELVIGVAELLLPLWREIHRVGQEIPFPQTHGCRVQDPARHFRVLAQHVLGLLVLGDVPVNAPQARHPAIRVGGRFASRSDVAQDTGVFRKDAEIDGVVRGTGKRAVDAGLQTGAVVGVDGFLPGVEGGHAVGHASPVDAKQGVGPG